MIPLTIVIPVYNVEQYIRDCLISCISQSLKNVEIIIVNDQTQDNSVKVIEDIIKSEKNIRLIHHDKNKGHGGALNTGIAAAKGEYIWFIDSDDFIDTYSCEFLYNYAKKKNLDALGFGANNFYVDNSTRFFIEVEKYTYTGFICDKLFGGKDFIKNAYCGYHRLNTPQWAYVFRSEAIRKTRFRENVSFEDNDGTPILIRGLSRISVLQYSPYYRRIHETNSIQYQKAIDKSKIEKTICQRLDIIDGLIKYIRHTKLKSSDPLVFFALRTFNTEIRPQVIELSRIVSTDENTERLKTIRKELYKLTKFRYIPFYRLFTGIGIPAIYRQRYINRKGFISKFKYLVKGVFKIK